MIANRKAKRKLSEKQDYNFSLSISSRKENKK